MEVKQADDEVYKDMRELADELPEHQPRFILLSYPLTLVCPLSRCWFEALRILYLTCIVQPSGRLSVPYVMLNYLPSTANGEMRMLYAGAKELMRNTSEVGKIIEVDTAEDLEEIEEKLKGDS